MKSKLLDITDEELDKLDEEAIAALLQSTDADSSSEDDVESISSKPELHPGSLSMWKAVVNIVNFIEGIGFLALPYTLKKGGISAIIALMVTPILLWYTEKTFIECLYEEKGKRKVRVRSTIKEVGNILYPKFGGQLVSCCIHFDVFLLAVSYLALCGSLMRHALPGVPITEFQWTCIAGALVLPTTFIKSLSQIAWLSIISVVSLVTAAITIVLYGVRHYREWDPGFILFWDTEGVIIAMSIVLCSYAALPILPIVEENMFVRAQFSRALALAHLINLLMKLVFSLFGALTFGIHTNEVILNNLPPGPVHIIVSSVFVITCIFSYVLVLYPVIESFDSVVSGIQTCKSPNFFTYAVVRISIVLLTVIVAVLVPHFALIVSFLGSLNAPFLHYIFPCSVHLKLRFKQLKLHQICVDVCLIILGVLTTVFGTAFSLKAIIQAS